MTHCHSARIEFIRWCSFSLEWIWKCNNHALYIKWIYLLLYNKISDENSNYPDEISWHIPLVLFHFRWKESSCGVCWWNARQFLSQVEYMHSVRWIYLPAERIQCVREVGWACERFGEHWVVHHLCIVVYPSKILALIMSNTPLYVIIINIMRIHESHAVHNIPSLHIIASTGGAQADILKHVIYLDYKQ